MPADGDGRGGLHLPPIFKESEFRLPVMPVGPPPLQWDEMWVPFDRLERGIFVTSSYAGGYVQSLRHWPDVIWPVIVPLPRLAHLEERIGVWRGRLRRAWYDLRHDPDPYDW